MKLNKEEKDILSAYENGSIKTKAPSKKELRELKIRLKIHSKKTAELQLDYMNMI